MVDKILKEKYKIYFNFGQPDKPKFKEIILDQLEELLESVYAYDNVRIIGGLKLNKKKYPNIYKFLVFKKMEPAILEKILL